MLVIGKTLLELVQGTGLCDAALVEEFSIQVKLGRRIRPFKKIDFDDKPITYGSPYNPDDVFEPEQQVAHTLLLRPQDSLLACSGHPYRMGRGYFGLIQTKGSLARLFVAATCNDGQVEPGFDGHITLELTNHGPIPIAIPVDTIVAQIFLFKCNTDTEKPYDGKYGGAVGPTVAAFK